MRDEYEELWVRIVLSRRGKKPAEEEIRRDFRRCLEKMRRLHKELKA